MNEREEFEGWFRSVMDGAIPIEYNSAQFGWGACRELKDAVIEKQAKELEALRGFANEVHEHLRTSGSGGLVYSSNIYDRFSEFKLIDESGSPTKLLTGESYVL